MRARRGRNQLSSIWCEEKRPIVSFEVKPWGDEDPDLVVANAKRALNLAWSKLNN